MRLCLTYISVCSIHNYGQQSVDHIARGAGVPAILLEIMGLEESAEIHGAPIDYRR
jgi:hypothetical protein